jgi:hypothetical protein
MPRNKSAGQCRPIRVIRALDAAEVYAAQNIHAGYAKREEFWTRRAQA